MHQSKKGENRTETKSNLRPFLPMICLFLFYSFSLHQSLVLESPEDVSSNHCSVNIDWVCRSCCSRRRVPVGLWRALHNLLPFVSYMLFQWCAESGKNEATCKGYRQWLLNTASNGAQKYYTPLEVRAFTTCSQDVQKLWTPDQWDYSFLDYLQALF